MAATRTILYVVNVDWFFISHRLPIALEAQKRGYNVAIATTNTGRFRELESYGFHMFNLKIERSGINPFKEFILFLRIIAVLRQFRPQIIHSVTLKMSIYCSLATFFVRNIKLINAISGLGYSFTVYSKTKSQKVFDMLIKLAFYNRGFSFIFQNPDDLQLFKSRKLDRGNKFFIIKGSGVNLTKFSYVERANKGFVSFILTARMLKDKGIYEFISAAKIVSGSYPDSKFLLVGDLDQENLASFSKEELNGALAGTSIKWLGHRNDILQLLCSSDVMVFPSYREGLPKSLIEAASVGLPIITTDAVGCRECVDDGINGFLVPIGDSEILAKKMIELIKDPTLRQNMGSASRAKAEKEFSIDMVINKTFQIYE